MPLHSGIDVARTFERVILLSDFAVLFNMMQTAQVQFISTLRVRGVASKHRFSVEHYMDALAVAGGSNDVAAMCWRGKSAVAQ